MFIDTPVNVDVILLGLLKHLIQLSLHEPLKLYTPFHVFPFNPRSGTLMSFTLHHKVVDEIKWF